MKQYLIFLLLVMVHWPAEGQVKFMSRYEVESDYFDPLFEMIPTERGLISFRTISKRAFSVSRVFQYFISDEDLKSDMLVELPVKEGFDMIGYDHDDRNLYILFQKGNTLNAEKYVLQIDLETQQGVEYTIGNLLEMSLTEFLVQNRSVIVMGIPDTRPVVQVYNLDDKSIHTLQGIYGNDTEILQIRKRRDIESFEVVLGRKGKYREREISINSYDLSGNLLREIKIDEFGEQGQEIMDALLFSAGNYRQMMVGAFGLERRNSYQGMYVLDFNEFGEYQERLYTLLDFTNFYNYLDERAEARKLRDIEKAIKKEKIPSIFNNYAIRQVLQLEDGLLLYFDQFDVVNSRGNYRGTPYSRGGFGNIYQVRPGMPGSADPFYSSRIPYPQSGFQLETEFTYESAHFIRLGSEGQVLWDNAANYDHLRTDYQAPFGDIALIGDELYHAYVRDDKIVLSYFKSGEKIFDNLDFEIELTDENERIVETNQESLKLVYWYDHYFLLTGTQKIRFQKENGATDTRDVYFVSKVLVAGDLYEPEAKLE